MKCPECQFENESDARFCNECGHKLEIACTECGNANQPGSKFCKSCGHDLREPQKIPPKDLSFDEKIEKIQRYLPKGLTDKILSQRNKIEGERRQVTVMFCDMEGFTPLVEKIGPEKAYSIMDQIYEILIHMVHDYEGTVNEMTGDGIMALFGAPIAIENASQKTIQSALSIHRELAKFNDQKRTEGLAQPIRMRIGVHTGPVVVGTLGNDLRVEFKVVGDTVNLASRMEDIAEPGTTYITEDTFRVTEGLFRFEALGEKAVKGKDQSVKVYRVIAPSTLSTRFEVSAERGLTPFVGRKRELDQLLDGFERAKAGRGQVFSIIAEAGVGKTRLLYEFRKAVANEDVTFREGRCLSYSQGKAYHPVIDILKSNFDIREGDENFDIREKVSRGLKIIQSDKASMLPYLLELLSVKDSGIDEISIAPEEKKLRFMEALRRITLKSSEIRPVIMAIEDLHWMDKSSENALKYLFESIAGARVLLIFTYRPEFVHTWGTKSFHSQVNLNRLSIQESLTMVTHLLGVEDIEEDLEDLILEKTEGVPFYVEEFIKSLRDLKVIERKDSKYHLAEDIEDLTIPSTIQDVIMARVDSLPEGAKEVIQTGSVIEREFSHELIERSMGLSERELLSHLSILKDVELLYERGVFPKSTYIFKHALTREVAYNSLLQKRRKEIHENVGQAIEQLYADRAEEFYEILAYHYSKSENLEKAYQYHKLSGDKGKRTSAYFEAFGFYKESLNNLSRMAKNEQNKRVQIGLYVSISDILYPLSYPNDSLDLLHQGERLSMEIEDKKSLSILHSRMGNYFTIKEADPLHGIEYTEKSFQDAEQAQDIESIVKVGRDLCTVCVPLGYWHRIRDFAPRVIELLEKLGKEYDDFGTGRNYYFEFYGINVGAQGWLGHFNKGEIDIEKILGFAQNINNRHSLALIEFYIGAFFHSKGDGRKAIEHCQNAINYFEEMKYMVFLGLAWTFLGGGYSLIGDLETARKKIEKAIFYLGDQGSTFLLSYAYHFLSTVLFESRNFREAQDCIEEAIELSRNNNERQLEGMSLQELGRVSGKIDPTQVNNAEASIREGIKILEELKIRPCIAQGYLYLGESYADTDQNEKSIENLKKAEDEFKDMGMDYWLARTYAVYVDLYKKEGDQSKAKENLNKAIEILRECGADGWVEKYEKELAAIS
jgi:class 3 adenylate cyclase/tetratricopeptide (TPR) repeat protein